VEEGIVKGVVGERKPLNVGVCGDILLGDFFFDVGCGVGRTISRFGIDYIFHEVKGIFSECDLLVGNLECPISSRTDKKGLDGIIFRADPSVAQGLKKAGFDALLVANNHINQHGDVAFRDTVRALKLSDVSPVGVSWKGRREFARVHVKAGGWDIGMLGCSFVQDWYEPLVGNYPLKPNREELMGAIIESRQNCDILVVLVHWGEEFIDIPSESQREWGHAMVDAGADLVIGSHPHMLQGVETYRGKTIAYSLGNFVFSMPWKLARATCLLKIRVDVDGSQNIQSVPLWIDDRFRPMIAEGRRKTFVEETISRVNALIDVLPPCEVEYSRMVAENLSRYRRMTKLYFLRNICRMHPKASLQLTRDFYGRRMR